MAGIEFDVIITKEGVDYARQVQGGIGKGWHLTPKRYEISSIASGIFNDTRNLASRNETWIARSFSGIYPLGSNKLLNNITIPADARTSTIAIREVYFVYENHDDEGSTEFLFAIARPTVDLEFTPGVSQSFKFLFTLNNIDQIESMIDVQYTYPEEISDHNLDLNAHDYFLKRDGSRTATGVLSYDSEKEFTSDLILVTKGWVLDNAQIIMKFGGSDGYEYDTEDEAG